MKAYKVEIMIIDFEEIGSDSIKFEIENARYANHCISPKVKTIEGRDIGEWSDEHPLNYKDKSDDEYQRLFSLNPEQNNQDSKMDVDELYDADPSCLHELDPACMSGIRCKKCGGWSCY